MHPIRANRPVEETEGILRQFNFSKKKVACPKTIPTSARNRTISLQKTHIRLVGHQNDSLVQVAEARLPARHKTVLA